MTQQTLCSEVPVLPTKSRLLYSRRTLLHPLRDASAALRTGARNPGLGGILHKIPLSLQPRAAGGESDRVATEHLLLRNLSGEQLSPAPASVRPLRRIKILNRNQVLQRYSERAQSLNPQALGLASERFPAPGQASEKTVTHCAPGERQSATGRQRRRRRS
jgi:hypothetical protein